MAGTSTDYLLQQILASNEQTNDNLKEMRDLLADNLRNNPGGGGNGGGGGGPRPPRRGGGRLSFKDAFKNITQDVNGFGRTLLNGSADVSTVTNSLGSSMSGVAGSLGRAIPAIGGVTTAFQLVVEAGMAVYNYMNQQLDMYNKISSSGVDLSQGMSSIRTGAANALVSMDKFTASVTKNADAVAMMDNVYGDGVKSYGDLLGKLQLAQDQIGLYGISQEQMADLTARNIKFQKQFGGAEMIRQTNQEKSTETFIKNMTTFSKSLGESVDSILAKVKDFDKSMDARNIDYGLRNIYHLSDEVAAATTKAATEAYAAMGEGGKDMMKLMGAKTSKGALPDYLINGTLAEIADMNERLLKSGETDSKKIRDANLKYIKTHKQQIDDERAAQELMGNYEASAFLKSMQELEAQANDPKNAPARRLEELTNKFNNWISNTFTKPFNIFFDKGVQWLLDITDKSNNFNQFMDNVFDQGIDFLMNMVQNFFKEFAPLSAIGKTLFGDAYDVLVDNVGGFIGDLVKFPVQLVSVVTDIWNGDLDSARATVQGAIASFKKHFFGWWDGITSINFSFTDVKDRLMDAFKALKDKFIKGFGILKYIFGDGEKPKDEDIEKEKKAQQNANSEEVNSNSTKQPEVTSTENNRKQPQVEAAPKITKPERIAEAQDNKDDYDLQTPSVVPPVNYDENIVEQLSRMNDALEQANQYNIQTSNYLRTISDNTQAQRNS